MAKTGDELLSALRDTNVDFSQLAKLLDITPENRGTFWKNLIELLKSRDNPLDGEGSSNSDEILYDNENAVFNFINYYCDLADKTTEEGEVYLSYIFDALKQIYIDTNGDPSEDVSFWNYSVQQMVDHYMEYFCSETDQDSPLVGGLDYTRRHIKNANAGLSFKDTPWVEPNFNVNEKTYDQVRKHDEVNDILANAHKMQFTHTRLQEQIEGQGGYTTDALTSGTRLDESYAAATEDNVNENALNKWIRLLMPQYGRRVEIEDLDRNFWVIAQVIAALSGFLFDDDSPITEMFKHLLNEIIQLWENVMYLWAEAAITSQKVCTNVRVITLPVPNTVEQPYRKFDNFTLEYTEAAKDEKRKWGSYDLRFVRSRSNENEVNNPYYIIADNSWTEYDSGNEYWKQALNQDEIRERIKFLIDKYSDDNLIIIPFERLRNYKHNWYGCQNYRYVYTYHRGLNKWKTYRIRTWTDTTTSSYKTIYSNSYYNVVLSEAASYSKEQWTQLSDTDTESSSKSYNDLIAGFPVTLAPIKYQHENKKDMDWIANHFINNLYHADKIYGIRKDEDNYSYDYISPFVTAESEDTKYYGNLRVEVDVDYDLNLESLDLTGITFNIYDAAAPMIEGSNVKIATYTAKCFSTALEGDSREGHIGYEVNETDKSPKIWLKRNDGTDVRSSSPSEITSSVNYETLVNRKSLYMGETVSYYNDYTIEVPSVLSAVIGVICEPPYETNYTTEKLSDETLAEASLKCGLDSIKNEIMTDSDNDSNIIIAFGVANNKYYDSDSQSLESCNGYPLYYQYYGPDDDGEQKRMALYQENESSNAQGSRCMSTYKGSIDGHLLIYFEDSNSYIYNDEKSISFYDIYTEMGGSGYNQRTQLVFYAKNVSEFLQGIFELQVNNLIYTKDSSDNITAIRVYPIYYQISAVDQTIVLGNGITSGYVKISKSDNWTDSLAKKDEYYEGTSLTISGYLTFNSLSESSGKDFIDEFITKEDGYQYYRTGRGLLYNSTTGKYYATVES